MYLQDFSPLKEKKRSRKEKKPMIKEQDKKDEWYSFDRVKEKKQTSVYKVYLQNLESPSDP